MRHKITAVLSVLIIFATGAYSVVAYQHYRTQYQAYAKAQHAKAVAAQQAQANASLQQNVRFNNELEKLKTQCAKDKAAYTALPAYQKTKTTAPDCNTQLVQ